jgi:hypothetical protein
MSDSLMDAFPGATCEEWKPLANVALASEQTRFPIERFSAITYASERDYLVKGLIPRQGLAVLWGPPKCGKSYFTFDLSMHVALGWQYRGRRVVQGSVVYVACEGRGGFRKRVDAFRQQHLNGEDPPFFLVPSPLDLIVEYGLLAEAIQQVLGDHQPILIVLDTLNRSLNGSEARDEDMAAYIKAADALQTAFECTVMFVHHCGIDTTRPRGHTSLTAAVDTQIAVKRDKGGTIIATVEMCKDDAEGEQEFSRLEAVTVGTDPDGDPITSCIIKATEPSDTSRVAGRKLGKKIREAREILHDAIAKWPQELPPQVRMEVPASVRVGVKKDRFRQHLADRGNTANRQQEWNRIADMKDSNLMGEFKGFVWAIH